MELHFILRCADCYEREHNGTGVLVRQRVARPRPSVRPAECLHPANARRDKQWAHVVHHQAPLVAAVELFLGGFDVSAGLLSLSPECMHASLRKAATTPSVTEATMQAQVPTDEDSIVKVVSQLFPFARGTDGDRDVAVAERVLGEKKG